jgi:ATP-dependent Lon protease
MRRSSARAFIIKANRTATIPTIPGELFAKFQTGFYADPVDAVFKALGVA